MSLVAGFVAGLMLGVVHLRLFHRSVDTMLSCSGTPGRLKVLLPLVGAGRYLLTLGAGICLVRGAALDPTALGGGLLVALVGYRAILTRSTRTEENTN